MKQTYAENTEYEILTPTGWQNFEGIFLNGKINKPSRTVYFSNSKVITATTDHRFFINGKEIKVVDLKIGDKLDSESGPLKITKIEETELIDTYEIFNATGHVINANSVYSHQCDEFAYVRPTIAKEFWTSISPTLATGGKAIITSTPNSDEDQFAILWKGANRIQDEYGNTKVDGVGANGFRAFQSTWQEHPDRDAAWGDSMRAQLGDDRFRREICCEFIQNDETLIAPAKLMDLAGVEPIKNTGQVRWYKEPKKGSIYVVSLDPSLGTGGDPAAIQVFDARTTEQVAEWRHNKTDIPSQIRIMADIIKEINSVIQDEKSIYYSVENNTIGEASLISIAEYGEQNIPGYFLSDNSVTGTAGRRFRKGFNTTHKSKITACNKFKILVESTRMKINSKSLVSELKNFVASGTSYAAKPGETDDLVMSTLLAVRMLMLLQTFHTEVDSQLKDHGDVTIEPMPFISLLR